MRVFDTDIVTEILIGNPDYAERLAHVPQSGQSVPIVVIEEILRGRLNVIRQAEAGKARITIERAYQLFEMTLQQLRELKTLSVTSAAEVLLCQWRAQKVKGSTHDLRIAAMCVSASATLVTRNRRDFENVPGLELEVWD